jgi:tRNA-intron endonuclease
MNSMVVNANLISGKVSSNDADAMKLFSSQRFGEKIGEKIFYSLSEALYLLDEKKLFLLDANDKKIYRESAVKKFQTLDKNFKNKYLVFTDLRKKGYVLKSALKFGADFRVYEKGRTVGEDHSKWILYATSENERLKWQDFSAKNRVAHSTKKKLLIAVVDEEGDVSYYESSWIKPQ